MSATVSTPNAEKVVKPPRKPVKRSSRISSVRKSRYSATPISTPAMRQPSTLTMNVPSGNAQVSVRASTIAPIWYRATEPTAPPTATSNSFILASLVRPILAVDDGVAVQAAVDELAAVFAVEFPAVRSPVAVLQLGAIRRLALHLVRLRAFAHEAAALGALEAASVGFLGAGLVLRLDRRERTLAFAPVQALG